MTTPPINLYNYHLLGVASKLHSKYTKNKPREHKDRKQPSDYIKNR